LKHSSDIFRYSRTFAKKYKYKKVYRKFAIDNIINYIKFMNRTKVTIEYDADIEKMAKIAKALGHPIRLQILQYLHKQSWCFTGDLVEVLPIAQSTVSQHLKELKNAGLIQGEVNPPKVKYCINRENWEIAKKLCNNFFE
jgi:DNA-binding HxlR family transcriptional regulator